MTAHVRVLADPLQIGVVCDACLQETSTIGLHFQVLDLVILQRQELAVAVAGRSIGMKAVSRSGSVTVRKLCAGLLFTNFLGPAASPRFLEQMFV